MSKSTRKDPAAVALGRKGGKAAAGAGVRSWRAGKTAEELSAIGKKAAKARWKKKPKEPSNA